MIVLLTVGSIKNTVWMSKFFIELKSLGKVKVN